MESKTLKTIGGVATVIGTLITGYAYYKFDEANSMIRALEDADWFLGTDSSSGIEIWTNHSDNYKIILIVGAVILVVGIILLVSGIFAKGCNVNISNPVDSMSVQTQENKDLTERLKKLCAYRL